MRGVVLFFFLVTIASIAAGQGKIAEKVDEFGLAQCEDLRTRLDSFLAELSSRPASTGLIIVYEGKYQVWKYKGDRSYIETLLPVRGEAAFRTDIFRRHFNYRRFDPGRYLFVDGGFRELHTVEMWIVPQEARLPAATPTLRDVKFRKGKPNEIVCD